MSSSKAESKGESLSTLKSRFGWRKGLGVGDPLKEGRTPVRIPMVD